MSQFRKSVNSILTKIQKGDKSQQKILYENTCNHLKAVAFKYVFDKNDCEDVLLEAFSKAFKYIDSYNCLQDGYNWLCKIVQNVAYDFNKRLKQTDELSEIIPSNKFLFMTEDMAEQDAVVREIRKLPPYEQRLIFLRFYMNLSFDEVAEEVKGKKSTVYQQIRVIIKKIKKNLQKSMDESL